VTTLNLQRIEISNFRAYGDNFSLSLPGPGVTILKGPDELWKSTFFEAIEWALTGRVHRLAQESLDRERNNGLLARREEEVPGAQYGVSLEFVNSEGESIRIERRAVREQENREQFAEASSPTQQRLIDLPRAGSGMNEPGDIGEYLRPIHLKGPRGGLPAEVFTEKASAIATTLKATFGVELVLEGTQPPAVIFARLLLAIEQAAAALLERKRVLSQAEEALNAWQLLDSTAAEARAQHAAAQAALVGLQNQLQAVLEIDERRRAAEIKHATLLQLSAARMKIAQGTKQKSSVAAGIDRHTHEMWMIQPHLHNTTKTIQRIKDLDSRIRSLLLAKQEIERCQQAHDEWCKEDEEFRSKEPKRLAGPTEQASHRARQETIQSSPVLTGVAWEQVSSHLAENSRRTQLELEAAQAARDQLPDLEYLNNYLDEMNEKISQLSSAIKEAHKVVAQLEGELLAAQALQQQHPELLSALGTLPSDEAHAINESVRAIEQLVHHERQLVQSEEPFPSVLARLNEELTQAQATSAQKAAEAENLEQQLASLRQRWLELGLQGFPSPVALDDERNKLAEQELELQQLRTSLTTEVDSDTACSSSTSMAYWRSRWPALLLDDPLQHHELIHAAAFIEIVRSLVQDRRYQVFLSIHDEELAASVRRQLEVAGIECVTCRC
jgi:hypothetical protein